MSRKCLNKPICDGTLEIIDVDDCSITVVCDCCGDEWCVEPDGLDEGGMEWAEAMAMRENGEI